MNKENEKLITEVILDSMNTMQLLLDTQAINIDRAAELWSETLQNSGKIMFCGNGGSAADAQHISTELMVRLKSNNNRPAMPAIALTTDTSLLTAAGNDLGFSEIFSRQIEGLTSSKDLLVAISTSGNSKNILRAVETARRIGIKTVGFLGKDGGKLKNLVDVPIVVPSNETGRIQESHIMIGHILCELAERDIHG
jgi:D-sedoheptulose 7-phosphate isomerase